MMQKVGTVCSIAAKLELSGQIKFDGQPQNFSSVAKFVADIQVLGCGVGWGGCYLSLRDEV